MFFLLLVFTHILHTTFYICSRILFWLHRIYAFSFTNTSIILFFCFLAFFLFLFLAIHTKIALFHYRPQRIFLLRHFLLKFFAKNSFFLIHASKYSSVHFVHFHKHKNPPKNQKKTLSTDILKWIENQQGKNCNIWKNIAKLIIFDRTLSLFFSSFLPISFAQFFCRDIFFMCFSCCVKCTRKRFVLYSLLLNSMLFC